MATQYEDCVKFGKHEDEHKLLRKAQSILISAQELGDEKLQIVQQLQDLIENRTRSLDNDYKNVGEFTTGKLKRFFGVFIIIIIFLRNRITNVAT